MSSQTLPQAGAARRKPFRNEKQAVFMVAVPTTWRPQRPWDWPPSIQGDIFARNLRAGEAAIFARIHNEAAMRRHHDTGEPIGQWAMVAKFLNPKRRATIGPTYPGVRLFEVPGGRVAVGLTTPGTPEAIAAALRDAADQIGRAVP